MLRGLGRTATATSVARLYRGLIDVFVLDERDRAEAAAIRRLGMEVLIADTLMPQPRAATRLASTVLASVDPRTR
jgi:LPPG:FO 2-phospho-L-lactate transferase